MTTQTQAERTAALIALAGPVPTNRIPADTAAWMVRAYGDEAHATAARYAAEPRFGKARTFWAEVAAILAA